MQDLEQKIKTANSSLSADKNFFLAINPKLQTAEWQKVLFLPQLLYFEHPAIESRAWDTGKQLYIIRLSLCLSASLRGCLYLSYKLS